MSIKWWKFDSLWTGEKYISPAYICTDAAGKIQEKTNIPPQRPVEYFPGLVLPGFKNTHSHAFQYVFAGQTESLGPKCKSDNFWTWRTSMYEVARQISPECTQAVATQLYTEMLRHGYTSVVEFHYLHHSLEKEEKSIAMAVQHITAALRTGIRLLLVPVFYGKGLIPQTTHTAQKRFHCASVEAYQDIIKELHSLIQQAQEGLPPLLSLGKGVHSLRTVQKKDLIKICETLSEEEPFHMHISEQKKEVSDCLKELGKSPIHWLFDTVNVQENFHFVHATHATKEELERITKAGASVILCPSTEANLGDGFFDFSTYRKLKGHWSIGTDSHIGLSPMEELRWLEYGMRLQEKQRNTICKKEKEESGEILYRESYAGALRAMGKKITGYFSKGETLDAIVVQSPQIELSSKKLSTLIYGATVEAVKATIVNGKVLVRNQEHIQKEEIEREYKEAIQRNPCIP